MTQYDFSTIMNREGHDAIAVEMIPIEGVEVREGFSKIPMWVADMNFPTLPTILEEIQERLKHPHFGYYELSERYYDSIINWHKDRYQTTGMKPEHIGYENGVLGAVSSAVQTFTSPGDSVLIHAPTYVGFTKTMKNIGRACVLTHLVQDAEGIWRMDFDDMEEKLKKHAIHCVIFCSPHNPSGRVWEKEEIERAMTLYQKYDCVVISDEIWADITLFDNQHIPTQNISIDAKERTIALYAPTKTFNLAGLRVSYHVIYNTYLRDRLRATENATHYNGCNVLSMHALIGAYRPEGREWVDELQKVLSENVEYAYEFLQTHCTGISLAKPEGTYMLFLDCEVWCKTNGKTLDDVLKAGVEVGVIWQDGRPFQGEWSIRMNVALPKELVQEAMHRLGKFVF